VKLLLVIRPQQDVCGRRYVHGYLNTIPISLPLIGAVLGETSNDKGEFFDALELQDKQYVYKSLQEWWFLGMRSIPTVNNRVAGEGE
jgi:hypothetical protein